MNSPFTAKVDNCRFSHCNLRPCRAVLRIAGLLALLLLQSQPAKAILIGFEAINLTDVTAGDDLWEYRYQVSDHVFQAGEGFSIFFDRDLYRNLEGSTAPNSDWDVISLQPDPALPADGLYDALALVSGPSLADLFSLSFIWLGTGTPGVQTFEAYDVNFGTLASGTTVAGISAVPESGPGVILTIASMALVCVLGSRRKRVLSAI